MKRTDYLSDETVAQITPSRDVGRSGSSMSENQLVDFVPDLSLGCSLSHYDSWETPTVIVSDGAYGIGGFDGDPVKASDLAPWYKPHIKAWTENCTSATTLWFWNTEIGWANVHPVLEEHGWIYHGCNIWDKGMGHVAGNVNSKTIRKFPVVSEVCVQYIRPVTLRLDSGLVVLKSWLRSEWERSGLPLYKANEACGVANAASRKYLTKCHLWYPPPPHHLQQLVEYANLHGLPGGRPYFDGIPDIPDIVRSKFYCPYGFTNVWSRKTLRGSERIKTPKGISHPNQKPLELMSLLIESSSDLGDVVWEPFGGLFSASLAAYQSGRKAFSCEPLEVYYQLGCNRFLEGVGG